MVKSQDLSVRCEPVPSHWGSPRDGTLSPADQSACRPETIRADELYADVWDVFDAVVRRGVAFTCFSFDGRGVGCIPALPRDALVDGWSRNLCETA